MHEHIWVSNLVTPAPGGYWEWACLLTTEELQKNLLCPRFPACLLTFVTHSTADLGKCFEREAGPVCRPLLPFISSPYFYVATHSLLTSLLLLSPLPVPCLEMLPPTYALRWQIPQGKSVANHLLPFLVSSLWNISFIIAAATQYCKHMDHFCLTHCFSNHPCWELFCHNLFSSTKNETLMRSS